MAERIEGPDSSSSSERKKIPNTDRFQREIEQVEKVGESELDKQKKRFFQSEEEKEEPPLPASPLKSYLSERESHIDEVPESPSFYNQINISNEPAPVERKQPEKTSSPFEERHEVEEKEKKKGKEEKKTSLEKKESLFSPQPPKKGKKTEEKKPLFTKKEDEEIFPNIPQKEKQTFEKFTPPSPKKEENKKEPLLPEKEKLSIFHPPEKKIEKEKVPPFAKTTGEKKEEKIKRKDEEKHKELTPKKEYFPQTKEAVSILKDLPPSVIAEMGSAVSAVAPYVKAENLPLFEKMVGTIIQMTRQGIEKSEILLNSPAFVGSKYYGTRIVFEKYASAPDSFNIHLTGTDEAITSFNENIDGLMQAFEKGNFSFRIGRLWAEYETERPLFSKKKSPGEEGKEERKE